MLSALAPNCCSWNDTAEWEPLALSVSQAKEAPVAQKITVVCNSKASRMGLLDFWPLISICKFDSEMIAIKTKLNKQTNSQGLCKRDFTVTTQGPLTEAPQIVTNCDTEQQWPEAEISLYGFAAEESTYIPTPRELQRCLLPQPSPQLRSVTPKPLLCCRSWSTAHLVADPVVCSTHSAGA